MWRRRSSSGDESTVLKARLAPQEVADGFFFQSVGPGGVHGFLVQIEIESELYLQIDELT